jgi:hypothetical protein
VCQLIEILILWRQWILMLYQITKSYGVSIVSALSLQRISLYFRAKWVNGFFPGIKKYIFRNGLKATKNFNTYCHWCRSNPYNFS